jgi:hypothetical protein
MKKNDDDVIVFGAKKTHRRRRDQDEEKPRGAVEYHGFSRTDDEKMARWRAFLDLILDPILEEIGSEASPQPA